jgi:hypothetical protein
MTAIPDPIQHHSYDNLPDCAAFRELTGRRKWVAWNYETRPGSSKPTKPPFQPRNGFKASNADPSHWGSYQEAVARAQRSRMAGVGYVLTDDEDIIGIDLDNCCDLETGEIEPWALAVLAHAETYAEFSPSGRGIRMFARGRIEKAVKNGAAGIELYQAGRYLTVTGWQIAGSPGVIGPAPHALSDLTERMAAFAPRADIVRVSAPQGTPQDELSELLSYVDPDCHYDIWIQAMMAVHHETDGQGFALVDAWSSRGSKYQGSKDVETHWKSFRKGGVTKATLAELARQHGADLRAIAIKYMPKVEIDHEAVSALIRHADGTVTDQDGVVVDVGPPQPRCLPVTFPPGLVGDIARWIVATATRPQPLLSIGAALAIVGTVAGRLYCSPSRSGTHLYIMLVAPTGMGKDAPLTAIQTIMKAAGMQHMVGPDDFTASPAVINVMRRSPACVCPMDEFGAFLKRINRRSAGGFESSTSKVLRTAWGSSFRDMKTMEYAQTSAEPIYAPAMSIVGATTIEEFYQSLADGDEKNGVLNRFLMLESKDRPQRVKPTANSFVAPQPIVDALKKLHAEGPYMPGEPPDPDPEYEGINARPVKWEPGAEAAYTDLLAWIDGLPDTDPDAVDFFARTAEMANRMATIVALGRGARRVSRDDFLWAQELAMASARQLMEGIRKHASVNDHQANYKLVRGIVEKAGIVSRTELLRRIQGRIDARTLDGIIKTLIESGEIKPVIEASSGRPKTSYKFG